MLLGGLFAVGAVLRSWNLSGRLSTDEALTGIVGRLPLGRMLAFLRTSDAHPPLDYLLRAPIARHTTVPWLLRLPSAALSILALAVVVAWMGRRGVFGIITVALIAVDPLLLSFAWTARMYAGVSLLGIVAAVCAEQWLRENHPRWAMMTGGTVMVALFLESSAVLLAGGLFLIPGLRRDRQADLAGVRGRRHRCVGSVWGPTLLAQLGPSNGAGYIPLTTPALFVRILSELVDDSRALDVLVLAAVVAGALILERMDRRMGRLVLCCFGVPAVAAEVIGSQRPFFLSKTLAGSAWAPMVALAALISWVWKHDRGRGLAGAAVTAAIVLPTTGSVLAHPFPAENIDWLGPAKFLTARARPGDAVAADPFPRFAIEWYMTGTRLPQSVAVPGMPFPAFVLGSRAWSGRVWVVETTGPLTFGARRTLPTGLPNCDPGRMIDGYRITCLVVPPGRRTLPAVTPGQAVGEIRQRRARMP